MLHKLYSKRYKISLPTLKVKTTEFTLSLVDIFSKNTEQQSKTGIRFFAFFFVSIAQLC